MAFDLDKSIDICLTCGQRFSSLTVARTAFQELGFLTVQQCDEIARKRRLDGMVIRGVTIVARYACMALDWLEYHDQPLTRLHLERLEIEFKDADAKRDVLKWQLHNGAWELLRKFAW